MSENALTHKALADLLGVSETTVKSYRRKFPGCFPIASQGKPIRFTPEAAPVALRIRDLFELGMSVEEVGLRLADEFTWCNPPASGPEEDRRGVKKKGAEGPENTPELASGVSSMAKTLVSMLQQQKAMVSRMEGVEALLEDLGLQGAVDAEDMRGKKREETRRKEERLEERLNTLEEATRDLAGTVDFLARELNRFLDGREQSAGERKNAGEGTVSPGQTGGGNGMESKVISLRQRTDPLPARPAGQGPGTSSPTEPPRGLLSLPLMVRTGEGRYISAGPRGRGRFSINDLKARLIYGYAPPHHFTLSWESHGQGWWLKLEQASLPPDERADAPRSYEILLMEVSGQGGSAVAEILQLRSNGSAVHPVEICGIIDSLGT